MSARRDTGINVQEGNYNSMKIKFYIPEFIFYFTLALLTCFFSAPIMAGIPLTVIYSGNLDGELEPCGCSDEGNLGGIKRRTTTLDSVKEKNPNAVILSAGGLITSEGTNDKIKSAYIFEAFSSLSYDAIGVQWKDLGFGVTQTIKSQIPWVSTNWLADDFAKSKMIRRTIAGERVAIQFFSWLDPNESPARQMPGAKPLTTDKTDALNKALQIAKQNKILTVLATTLPYDLAKNMFPLKHVDILIVRAAYEVYGKPKQVENTLVLQPGSRGMRLGELLLDITESGSINKWSHKIIPMPEKVGDAPRMQAWYEAYNAEVKADYLKRVELRKQRESGESPFVGEEQCKTCHAAQYKVWQESEHAIAYEDLEVVQKSFDPECLICHVVGFNEPGGFVDMNITSHLLNVQCENCHGAGKAHVESAGKKPVANKSWTKEKMCQQCHVQKHSPSFDVEKYWPKIAH